MVLMKVKEVCKLAGISARTLHHYDAIGLLKPKTVTKAGYRLYSDENLETLQQILFFRELNFPLKKIKEIIHSPSFHRLEALDLQRKMLMEKRNRLDQMITTINKTMQQMKGEIDMSNEEKFEGFDFSHNPYEKEARRRFGNEAINKSNAKLGKLSGKEQEEMRTEMNNIYRKLASLRNDSPKSDHAQLAIKEWYDFLNNRFGCHYSLEAFKGLGQMYVEDERFTKNIDQFGEGLAVFMCDAMAIYADHNKSE